MTVWQIALCVAAAVALALTLAKLAYAVAGMGLRFWRWRDRPGEADRGLLVFVHGVKFFGKLWDYAPSAVGFRRAGFDGRIVLWDWHSRLDGLAMLPPIVARRRIEAAAARLAEFLADRRRERPGSPLYVVGCSAGGYVAVRALELLPPGVTADGAALLSPAVDPWRDLSAAASHVARPIVVTSSPLDVVLLGAGTLLFGTGDRRHTPSMGMLGARNRASNPAPAQVRWRPALMRLGWMGGHSSAVMPDFLARRVAPLLGIRPAQQAPCVSR